MLVRATSTVRPPAKATEMEGSVAAGDPFRLEVSRVQPLFLARDMDHKMYVCMCV